VHKKSFKCALKNLGSATEVCLLFPSFSLYQRFKEEGTIKYYFSFPRVFTIIKETRQLIRHEIKTKTSMHAHAAQKAREDSDGKVFREGGTEMVKEGTEIELCVIPVDWDGVKNKRLVG
jgi:hypothetical protein